LLFLYFFIHFFHNHKIILFDTNYLIQNK